MRPSSGVHSTHMGRFVCLQQASRGCSGIPCFSQGTPTCQAPHGSVQTQKMAADAL